MSLATVLNIICEGTGSFLLVHSCAFQLFEIKEIGKKEKHPERGDWDINGGGVMGALLFKGIDIFSGGGGGIQFLVRHFEKGTSDFSRKIINNYTILFYNK